MPTRQLEGVLLVVGGLLLISETDLVRDNPEKLARAIIDLIARHRSRENQGAKARSLRVVK